MRCPKQTAVEGEVRAEGRHVAAKSGRGVGCPAESLGGGSSGRQALLWFRALPLREGGGGGIAGLPNKDIDVFQ